MPGRARAATMALARKVATMMIFGFWLLAGVAIGMILMVFLAIGTYQRGYDEGYFRRRPWRSELAARRQALVNAYVRRAAVTASSSMSDPSPVVVPQRAAASNG